MSNRYTYILITRVVEMYVLFRHRLMPIFFFFWIFMVVMFYEHLLFLFLSAVSGSRNDIVWFL